MQKRQKRKHMFRLRPSPRELLDCIRIIDFGLLPVSTLQSILISCILNKFLKIKNFTSSFTSEHFDLRTYQKHICDFLFPIMF